MTDNFDYQTAEQKAEESAWKLADDFQASKKHSDGEEQQLLTNLKSKLNTIDDVEVKDNIYQSMATVLAMDLQAKSVISLIEEIQDDAAAILSARQAAHLFFDKNSGEDGKLLLTYGGERIDKIKGKQEKIEPLIDFAGGVLAAKQDVTPYLRKAEEFNEKGLDQIIGMERQLEIAETYQKANLKQNAKITLDKLPKNIGNVDDSLKKDSLLFRTCQLYVQINAYQEALSLAKQFSSDSISLNARSLAQETIISNKDYAIAGEFYSLIEVPFQRFLCLETWLAQAGYSNDTQRMAQAAEKLKELLSDLSPGEEKFEACMLLARYYSDIDNEKQAKKYIYQAKDELSSIASAVRKSYIERLQALEIAI